MSSATSLASASPRPSIRDSDKIRLKYPDRVPVIVQFSSNFKGSEAFKTKYLVPQVMICSEFQYVLRRHMTSLNPDEAIFMFINKKDIPIATSKMGDVYEKNKDANGFLYITVVKENTFG